MVVVVVIRNGDNFSECQTDWEDVTLDQWELGNTSRYLRKRWIPGFPGVTVEIWQLWIKSGPARLCYVASSIFSLASLDSLETQKNSPCQQRYALPQVRNQIKMIHLKCSAEWTLMAALLVAVAALLSRALKSDRLVVTNLVAGSHEHPATTKEFPVPGNVVTV